jgi:4-amino-4-deoxychorismate lyase
MSRFIETIRAENGVPQMISLHQQRVDRTLKKWPGSQPVDLSALLSGLDFHAYPSTRIRIEYGTKGFIKVETFEYFVRQVRSVRIMEIGARAYRYKYADREWIIELLRASGCDEIIMARGGMVTDASIANLAFFNGKEWLTPEEPLLPGTQRQMLMEKGVIKAVPITLENLSTYKVFKLMNAMLPWNESPELDMGILTW